jgi:hypothetical protein
LSCAEGQLWAAKFYDPSFEHTLNLALDIVDGVGRLDLKGNSLTREGLDEDLHLRRSGITKTTVSSSLFDRKQSMSS